MKTTSSSFRSAKTGRYVSKEYAHKHPHTTVKERDKRKRLPGPIVRWITKTLFRQF